MCQTSETSSRPVIPEEKQTTGSIRLDFQKTTGAAAAAVSFLLPLAVRLLTTSSGETYTIFFKN